MFFSRAVRTHQVARSLVMAGVALALYATVAPAGEPDPLWGAKMVDVKEIKFGSVAKGADTVAVIKVKNLYQETIEIANLTTGCGCVSWDEARANPNPFPIQILSGQTQVLHVRLNTIQYDGERKSKATVTLFDRVHAGAEFSTRIVDIPVEAYIRKDIVITPGTVNFGAVDLGSKADRKLEIRYAGRPDWRLTSAKVSSPYLTAVLTESSRGGGLVNYDLLVSLKPDAPKGILRDQVTMVTDDLNNPQISVPVEAKVEPDIVVLDLQYGALVVGQTKSIPAIIRGNKPFKIKALYREQKPNGGDPFEKAFKFSLPEDERTVHSMPIKIIAPDAPGIFDEEFFLEIVGREQPISFRAKGRISSAPVPAGAAKN